MAEHRALLNTLRQSLSQWPKELIPLVGAYAKVSVHEWKSEHLASFIEVDKLSLRAINIPLGEYAQAYAKYTLGQGSCRWAMDVTFCALRTSMNNSFHNSMSIGISDGQVATSRYWLETPYVRLYAQHTAQRVYIEIHEDCVTIKISDLITPDFLTTTCIINFSDIVMCDGSKPVADNLYFTMELVSDSSCWATFVQEEE